MSRVSRAPLSYLFLAATAAGRRRVGVRQAPSPRALAESLRKERLLLLKSWALPSWVGGKSEKLSMKDQALLNEILGQLLTRGVPLVEALEVTASTVSPAAKSVVERVREQVSSGVSFSDACERTGTLDAVTSSVYRAAERTGDLGGAAAQLARSLRRQLAVAGKAVTLMIYPAIVLSVTLTVAAGMLMFIVPRIGSGMREAVGGEANIPWFSEMVFRLGEGMRANWAVLVVVLVLGVFFAVLGRRRIGAGLKSVARRVPATRGVVMSQEMARFFAVMAAMTRSGVPLAEALGTANSAVGHPRLRRQLDNLRSSLIEGGSLPQLIEKADAMPLATRRLLVAAERTGELESAFDTLAGDMADEVDRRSQRLLAALEPGLIILMFLIIGPLVLAIMIPMITAAGQAG